MLGGCFLVFIIVGIYWFEGLKKVRDGFVEEVRLRCVLKGDSCTGGGRGRWGRSEILVKVREFCWFGMKREFI